MSDDYYLADPGKRKILIDEVNDFWEEIKKRIKNHVEGLNGRLTNSDSKYSLNHSYDVLERIVSAFSEPKYIEKEDEYVHRQILQELIEVFNALFDSFILENRIKTNEEKVDALCNSFFRCTNYLKYQKLRSSRRNLITIPNALDDIFNHNLDEDGWNKLRRIESDLRRSKDFIAQSYSTITRALLFLSNLERHTRSRPHRPRPTDWITRKKSFGNLHTITSLFILSTYAYLEILKIWLEILS